MGEPIFEDETQVNALQGFQPYAKPDPFAPTYNSGWRSPKLFLETKSRSRSESECPEFSAAATINPATILATATGILSPASSTQRFESVEASMKRIETQVGQLVGTVGELVKQNTKDKLPSNSEKAHAISILRSSKVVDNKVEYPHADESSSQEAELRKSGEKNDDAKKKEKKKDNGLHKAANHYKPLIPFPSRLRNAKQDQQFNDFYKLLSKVNVNLPLLDGIRNVPHQLPPKQRDLGSFVIKIALGNGKEASVDRSVRYPKGIVEDILVKVGGLIVPVDFVVLDVEDVRENGKEHTLWLGRPFMATINTLIDVKNGTLKMTVLGETMSFSIRDNSVIPATSLMENCSFIDAIDAAVEMVFLQENSLNSVLADSEAVQLSELYELRNEAYDNAKIYKEKVKKLHDRNIVRKELRPKMKVLLFNSWMRLFSGKLRSHWSGPFEIEEVFPYGVVKLFNPWKKESFQVNSHRVKPYIEGVIRPKGVESIVLDDVIHD
ncbi:uncharacterized protein LOC130994216 [Salvia miltiorrhiza]|uniref:uncharacterized protein LOC130994216 n=1 Tax=Salvia miltiorrhiza TaxID=226208 RepID=UPI0025ACC45F|nr:uncharacterized protein LOC130994216 [Salvia miltiorrhiza]